MPFTELKQHQAIEMIKKKFISARAKPPLKKRHTHKKSFNVNEHKNETEVSNEIWWIKDLGHRPKVKWEIVKKMRPIEPTNKTLSTMLKRKVGNCCTQRTEPIKQKYAPARYDTKD